MVDLDGSTAPKTFLVLSAKGPKGSQILFYPDVVVLKSSHLRRTLFEIFSKWLKKACSSSRRSRRRVQTLRVENATPMYVEDAIKVEIKMK